MAYDWYDMHCFYPGDAMQTRCNNNNEHICIAQNKNPQMR